MENLSLLLITDKAPVLSLKYSTSLNELVSVKHSSLLCKGVFNETQAHNF
jgi:hypothetical protein